MQTMEHAILRTANDMIVLARPDGSVRAAAALDVPPTSTWDISIYTENAAAGVITFGSIDTLPCSHCALSCCCLICDDTGTLSRKFCTLTSRAPNTQGRCLVNSEQGGVALSADELRGKGRSAALFELVDVDREVASALLQTMRQSGRIGCLFVRPDTASDVAVF